jgi:hypothetical protein
MAYYVNKTDGTAILILDGTKDTTSTSLTLFGRLSQTYGENLNENFVRLLENFALGSSPDHPIVGQLWYDTATNNIKSYDGTDWITVGSYISGNVTLTGNLFIGPNSFQIQDLGDVSITNRSNVGDISFYGNINGTNTRTLYINGATGLVEVTSNATASLGVTTKIYVDSEIAKASSGANVALAANVAIINANLAVRTITENDLYSRINAADTAILLKDSITRVDSINSAIDTAITSNVGVINANLAARVNQTIAVETAMSANVAAANLAISSVQSDVSNLAPKASPTFTGIPAAPTASSGTNTTQIATTAFVASSINGISIPDTSGLAPKESPTFTGIPAAPTASSGTNTTQIATTAFVSTAISALSIPGATDTSGLAPKESPTFTGIPAAPTASSGTNTTQIATTAFVSAAISAISIPGETNLTNVKWQGSAKFVSTTDPTSADGADGDFWFKYS